MTSCASQKAPASLANQPAPIWIDDIDEFDTLALHEPIQNYETFGEVYAQDPEEVNIEKAPVIGQEVEDIIGEKKLSEVPLPDVPLVLNQQVEKWMDYFQGRGRKYFIKWLGRSGRYVPMMKQILRENGIPEGLIYLSMIESGFSPNAYSRAKAVGPWQFMKFTGERYGLRANYWIDERMDAEKST
ncbi:MAG: transglycosylase SLT domain-containing protein, partial [Proteobacteria bacterium]|nr:transglycosylase SLT domain-containing protein [Pseudomonadota bacterium]